MKGTIYGAIAVLLISVLEFAGSESISKEGSSLRSVRSIVNFGKKCKPETKFTEGCNLCICSIYGYALCTAMDCHAPVIYSEPKEECTPGRRWKQDCNTCYCSEDAEVKCSDLQCDGLFRESNFITDRVKREMFNNEIEEKNSPGCSHGEVIKNGCSYCFCIRQAWKCITMMCLGPELSASVGKRLDSNRFKAENTKSSFLPI